MIKIDEFQELALGSQLKSLSDALYNQTDQLYETLGIPFQARWFPVIALLDKHGEQGIGDLASAMGQTHSAVSQMSKKLHAEGWLVSRTDLDDERRRLISLSESGQQLVNTLTPIWRDIRAYFRHTLETHCPTLQSDISRLQIIVDGEDFAQNMQTRLAARQPGAIKIVPYDPQYRAAFFDLNARWIESYFTMEPGDRTLLADPQTHVLDRGGMIFFATFEGRAVGTCAVYPVREGVYEFTKMAVDPLFQSMDIGRDLTRAAIDFYLSLHAAGTANTLFLESSSILGNALALYSSLGFERQSHPREDSGYDRADVYMIYRHDSFDD